VNLQQVAERTVGHGGWSRRVVGQGRIRTGQFLVGTSAVALKAADPNSNRTNNRERKEDARSPHGLSNLSVVVLG
jgi:hypothetical protein